MRHSAVGPLSRRRAWVVSATLVGVVAGCLAATTQASGRAGGTIYACVKSATGAVRIVDASAPCKSGERRGSWSSAGDRGARGVPGARGPSGLRGVTGAAGAQGLAGARGAQGAQGAPGAAGAAGHDGGD